MTFRQFLIVLMARWKVFAGVLLAAVLAAVTANTLMTKQYTATAAVVIDVKSPDPIAGMVLPGMMTPGYIATQVDVMQSERVATNAARALRMFDNGVLRQQWQDQTKGLGSFESWLSDLIQKSLEIKPSRDSSVVGISYTAVDPQFAAAMANAFVDSYIETTLELRIEPAKQYSKLFEAQSKQARARLEAAQDRLSIFQRENGLIATDERLDVENARLAELSSQLVGMQTLSAESYGRKQQSGSNSQEVLNNAVVSSMKSDMSRAEARLKELDSKFGPAHPQVQELQANIAEMKSKIDTEISRVTGSVGLNNNVNQYRESQLRQSLESQRQKLMKLKELRNGAAVLQRDVEGAQRDFDSITSRRNLVNIESQSNQTNISVVRRATPPLSFSSPRSFLNVVVALFVGGMLAMGITLLVEFLDRRLRSEDDVVVSLNVPLLGEMPNAVKGKGEGRLQSYVLNLPKISKRALPELMAPKV